MSELKDKNVENKDKKKKQKNFYYEAFEEIANVGHETAKELARILQEFSLDTFPAELERMHQLEHKADQIKHKVVEFLYKDFLPPIERDDIIELLHQLDNVVDALEDVVIKMDMYHITSVTEQMIDFAILLEETTAKICEMIDELHHFKKSKSIYQNIIIINDLEGKADAQYVRSVKKLFLMKSDPLSTFSLNEIYSKMERCSDCCENVANTVEAIILKNS